jgi:hypothetical protein
VAAEDLERPAAEQERVGVAVELDDELADGRVGNGACQPPWVKEPLGSSSGPPGACITPSRVRNVCTVSFMSLPTKQRPDSQRRRGCFARC